MRDDLDGAEIGVSFARVRQPVRNTLERSKLMDRVGEERVLPEVDDAGDRYIAKRIDPIAATPK